MSWKRVLLTRDDINAGKHIRLQDDFEQAFLAAGGPKAAAMFQNDPSDDEYGFYFTPAAVEIFSAALGTLNATECDAPPRAKTSLLFGEEGTWDLLSADANKPGM
jgi:hypothetical protein